MTDLHTALNVPGAFVDLGDGVYDLHGSVIVNGRTIVGTPTIRWTPDSTRNSPAFILKGTGPNVSGMTIIGPAPDGAPYDATREGQHAFRTDGASSPQISNCAIRNIYGDGIYTGTVGELAHGAWTTNLTVSNVRFDQIGRHAITANALDGGFLTGLDVGRCNLAIVDIEPPGHPWGCKHLQWSNSVIRDSGGGFVLANKGIGTSDSVHDITLDGIQCLRRLFNVQVNPVEPGTRRQHFTIRNCVGAGVAYSPPLNFHQVDGVSIVNVRQALGRGVDLVAHPDCTGVVIA